MEHIRALLREWNAITFASIMSKYPDKKVTERPELLVAHIQDILSGLTKEYNHEGILKIKPLKAVKVVDACQLAYLKPIADLPGNILDLHAPLAATSPRKDITPQAFFIDRNLRGD